MSVPTNNSTPAKLFARLTEQLQADPAHARVDSLIRQLRASMPPGSRTLLGVFPRGFWPTLTTEVMAAHLEGEARFYRHPTQDGEGRQHMQVWWVS